MAGQKPRGDGKISIGAVSTILDLLVRDLYGSDPYLTLRELIQNAHDALMELPEGVGREQPIRVNVDGLSLTDPYIEVVDRGIGMSEEDIRTNLCIVGNSTKLRSENPHLIGKYGIGFLSAFIVADRVEVLTRRLGANETLRWETRDKENWSIEPVSDHLFPHGTRVRLYFKDAYSREYGDRITALREVEGVEEIIRRHCYLLPVTIQVAQGDTPGTARQVNAQDVPWGSDREARNAFRAMFGQRNEPLFVHRFDVGREGTGHSVSGVLYLRDEISISLAASLHVKKMLVDREVNRLIPSYAPFVQAIVECPALPYDLARRTVKDFDPVYLWVREVVAKEFEKAFIEFAQRRPDDFYALWPNIDNTVIGRLIQALLVDDEAGLLSERESAESFLLNASRYIPFYVVNDRIGAQGQPMWRAIDEIVGRDHSPGSEKAYVYYSDSANPIEKEMLLSTYPEIIDVSRAEKKSHQAMLMQMQVYNDQFPDFQLRKVNASRFEPLPLDEHGQWNALLSGINSGINFTARQHEVRVERFEPASTAIAITDSHVDPDNLENIKTQLGSLRDMSGSETILEHLLRTVEAMEQKGGVLTIHVNANNDLMRRLSQSPHKDIASRGAMAVCWRAVLDYYGWNSTRSMITTEKRFTGELIVSLLETTEAEAKAADLNKQLSGELRDLKTRLSELERAQKRLELDAFVGVLDMQGSTAGIIGNAASAPMQAVRYLRLLLADVKEFVETFARVIGFTGDGLQFYIPKDSQVHRSVHTALTTGLADRLRTFAERNEEARQIVRETRFAVPVLRVALAYGRIHVGPIVSTVDLMGLPAVEATRLCANEQLYVESASQLLITEGAYNEGTDSHLWKASDFETGQVVDISGLATSVRTFRPVR
ncbi:ATP-binding protein [Streptomyces parvulus]